ncbi:hypothetical protein COY87_02585 [Candidatus Roizmanbacteria bacterium CG_4_10_14_0_8_um_filter_33_9]|uniref:Uncharacterized protein n=1 Tax=Candidatus Roizmanbacteria bacterium CG_4_10_14_0_8_um_filter_33_9 TaxID=1974826 RepID=A0A2M7QIJ5_9BACT|nr:MAG: hypothetical protein COY87_02585 [Candidatus Roizmanbacteria bacterium CG_4_10_14_0_8_um_filter_33_9]
MITPLLEKDANTKIKDKYESLKKAFHSKTLPNMFTYIGAFPDYFLYISEQLIINLQDKRFDSLASQTADSVFSIIKSLLSYSEETSEWLNRYKNSPSFYYFQQDVKSVFVLHMKLAFISIALREAVKGWAVAAKKLPTTQEEFRRESKTTQINQVSITDDFETLIKNAAYSGKTKQSDSQIMVSQRAISSVHGEIERDLLQDYLRLCRNDFLYFVKREYFLTMRVQLEKLVLASLPLFPHLIFSPINVALPLGQKYPNFSELLYLLCDDFPVLSMQKLIFSGYMKV